MKTDSIRVNIRFRIENHYSAERGAAIAGYRLFRSGFSPDETITSREEAPKRNVFAERGALPAIFPAARTAYSAHVSPVGAAAETRTSENIPEVLSSFIERTSYQEKYMSERKRSYDEYLETYYNEDIPLEYEISDSGLMIKDGGYTTVVFDEKMPDRHGDPSLCVSASENCVMIYRTNSDFSVMPDSAYHFVFKKGARINAELMYDGDGYMNLFSSPYYIITEELETHIEEDRLSFRIDFSTERDGVRVDRSTYSCFVTPKEENI